MSSPARPLGKTIEGCIGIWRIVGRQISVIPPTGYGPGAFALRFARWKAETGNRNNTVPPSFTGLQDHARNDYLEFLVDLGFIGLLGLGIVTALMADFIRSAPTGAHNEQEAVSNEIKDD
jgi:O-antigen ligase